MRSAVLEAQGSNLKLLSHKTYLHGPNQEIFFITRIKTSKNPKVRPLRGGIWLSLAIHTLSTPIMSELQLRSPYLIGTM